MAESGYLDWLAGGGTGRFLYEKPWVGGAFTSKPMPTSITWTPRITQRLVEKHDGTHVRVGTYRGDKAPEQYSAYGFSFQWLHKYDEDWNRFEDLFAGGATFTFSIGIRAVDVFEATSGQTYTLSRPIAAGVVTGVTTSTHPHEIFLDGASDPTAASIATQTVTANDTGTIKIRYTPLFTVEFAAFSTVVANTNRMLSSVSLVEAITGDFA